MVLRYTTDRFHSRMASKIRGALAERAPALALQEPPLPGALASHRAR
jgi:hypothetical protein